MLSKSRPAICTHQPIKCHSEIHYDFIVTKARCVECGIKVKIQIKTNVAQSQKDMSVMQYIEYRVRRTMTVYARKAEGLPI